MTTRSRRAVLAIAISALLVINARILFDRMQQGRDDRKAQALGKVLVARSQKLQSMQEASNRYRDTIGKAFDSLDGISNSLRAVGGSQIANAQAAFPSVLPIMDEARKSNVRLPKVTQQIIDESGKARIELGSLLGLVDATEDIRYLNAFDDALALLIATHMAYMQMNAKISETFTLYEALLAIEDKFLTEIAQGAHRDKREASKMFRELTSSEVKVLAAARGEIDRLDAEASRVATQALEAFQRAVRLRPAP